MVNKVQIYYEEVETIAKILAGKRDNLSDIQSNVGTGFHELQGKWVSPAAKQFFNRTEPVLVRFSKLVTSFEDLVISIETIASTIRDIEEDAKSQFNWLQDLSDSGSNKKNDIGLVPQQPKLDTSNEPWKNYIGKTSSDQISRAQGCVAYVLDTTYVPWVSDVTNIAPGNANQWEQKALDWAKVHPESGITVDDVPRPGSIATWKGGGGGFGHVGKVESVNGKQFTISSGNTWKQGGGGNAWGRWYGQNNAINSSPNISTHQVDSGVKFIHFPWEEL